jgi:PAS domain S-box-containing protein
MFPSMEETKTGNPHVPPAGVHPDELIRAFGLLGMAWIRIECDGTAGSFIIRDMHPGDAGTLSDADRGYIGREASALFTAQDKTRLEAILKEVCLEGKTASALTRLSDGLPGDACRMTCCPLDDRQVLLLLQPGDKRPENQDETTVSLQRLRDFQDSIPFGFFTVSSKGVVLFADKQIMSMMGVTDPEEIVNRKVAEFYSRPKQQKDFLATLNKEGKVEDLEITFKRKDGRLMHGWAAMKVEYDEKGKPLSYHGFMQDITRTKKKEEIIRASDEKFRILSENLQSGVYIFNETGTFEYVNPVAVDITGYSKEELLGMNFFDLVHPSFRKTVKNRGFARIRGKRVPAIYEFKIITKAGKERWVEVSNSMTVFKGRPVIIGTAQDITARKEAEEGLKESEKRHRNLYSLFKKMSDNVQDMIWMKDLDRKYLFVNKALAGNLLLTRDTIEPLGKTDLFFARRERRAHPNVPDWHTFGEEGAETDKTVLESRRPLRYEEHCRVRGKPVYLDVIKVPFVDKDGEIIGIIGSARDITRDKLQELERRRMEQVQQVEYNISNAVNLTKDLDELFVAIRRELGRILDTTNFFIALYDAVKDTITLPYMVDDRDEFSLFPGGKTLTKYLLRQNTALLLHEPDIHALEMKGEIEIVGTPAKVWLGVPLQVRGELIGALVIQNYHDEKSLTERDLGIMQFVSNQVGLSIDRKKAWESLRENEMLLRQIIDLVPHMIYAKDEDGVFLLANKATSDAFGRPVSEIENHFIGNIVPGDGDLKALTEEDAGVISRQQTSVRPDVSFRYPDDTTHVFQTIKIPFHVRGHEKRAMLGVIIDITQRKTTEMALKTAKNKAEEADKLKTAFLANMSHEIRTPMNAIVGFAELLTEPDITEENKKEYIRLINENCRNLLNLIQDIIDVSRIEAEQIRIVRSECRVDRILAELASHFRGEIAKAGRSRLEIRVDTPGGEADLSIISDPHRLRQIFMNLVGNAIKFTGKGSIVMGYRLEPEEVVFHVSDTGIGIPKDMQEMIFERFRQVDESATRAYSGAGLGLTITKKLVEILGGRIWVRSQVGEGSTFFFTLPKIFPAQDALETVELSKLSLFDWKDKTVLVAEDEESNYELVKAILEHTGARVLWAKNGREAVDACLGHPEISVVIMDIRMPVMNGYEAAAMIRKRNRTLPMISLTAFAMAEDRMKSTEAGFNQYITKPFKASELLSALVKYLS